MDIYWMKHLRDLLDLRFPDTVTGRESYFVYVSRRRVIWAFMLGLLLGSLF